MNTEILMLIEHLKIHQHALRTEYADNAYIEVRFDASSELFDVTIEEANFFDQPEHTYHHFTEKQFLQYLIDCAQQIGIWR